MLSPLFEPFSSFCNVFNTTEVPYDRAKIELRQNKSHRSQSGSIKMGAHAIP